MGVHGLWRLIEPSGKPVPLETLENKVLAVDVSIWLHQAIKGFQDSKGAPVPNAHLLGIYHRVCKLLYFKVKPIFIFDGGVPVLKKQTIAKRHQQQSRNISEADRLQKQLLSTLLKHSAVSKILSEKTKASLILPPKKTSKYENMYALPPPSELESTISSSDDEDLDYTTSDTADSSPTKHYDLHTIDMSSVHFKSLPVDVRHEILTELKETRKQNSWGKLHELPKQSDDFSVYQMRRLLKRQAVQSALEDAEKEMGGHSLSMAELESILKDHGVATTNDVGKRIASDENTRYLLIKDIKQAMETARKKEQIKLESKQEENTDEIEVQDNTKGVKAEVKTSPTKADLEYQEDLQKAITLSLQEKPSTSKIEKVTDNNSDGRNKLAFSFLENFKDEDFQSDSSEEIEEISAKKTFSSAQNFMMEYSGLTPNEIAKILHDKNKPTLKKNKRMKTFVKPALVDNVEIMSDSDESNEFEEVSLSDQKNDNILDESSDIKEKYTTESNSGVEDLKINSKIETASSNIKFNEATEKHDVSNSNGVSKHENIEVFPTSEVPVPKSNCVVKNDNADILVKNTNSERIEKNLVVDIMSDSDSSSSIEFVEVSDNKLTGNFMEIVIDPNESIRDDLFSDIFHEEKETQNTDSIPIVIQPQTRPDDVFNEEVTVVADTNTIFVTKEIPETKTSLEVIKEDEVLVTQNMGKFKEGTTSSKNENVINFKSSTSHKRLENNEIDKETKKIERQQLNVDQMTKLKNDLQNEKIDLMIEKSTKERMASNITDQMFQEAQDLLELFGVPYIVAPMEAEAQCAFLDEIELTDGTITDDSDIWLFGGRTVYKNFFDQRKYVMEFKAENIQHNFKLTREQMILLALLVGSDYTTGLQGVGPVTALEILAAFPPCKSNKEISLSQAQLISGLKEFRSWFTRGKTAGPGRSTLKNKLKNVSITHNFPSLQVVQAYLEPTVETSREKFSWSKPNFIGLKEFAREKFGWSAKKVEEILKPVIKRVEESRVQKSIKEFFKTVHKVESHEAENKMSKRVKTAINRIGKTPDELIAEEMEALSKEKQKNTRKKKNVENDQIAEENKNIKKTARKRTKQGNSKVTVAKSEENTDVPTKEMTAPKAKRSRRKNVKDHGNSSITNLISTAEKDSKESRTIETIDEDANSLEKYQNIAIDNSEITVVSIEENTGILRKQMTAPKTSRKNDKSIKNSSTTDKIPTAKKDSQDRTIETIDEDTNSLETYENIAIELKKRRQRKIDLSSNEDIHKKKQKRLPSKKMPPTETIPEVFEEDEEVQLLKATTSRSLKRVEEIDQEVKDELNQDVKKQRLPDFHKREVIHQKLRDKSDVLRNKLKAIEVFRKSKRGPGYVKKQSRNKKLPKEDAGLSENSSDE